MKYSNKLINIGFGKMVAASRVVAIVSPESAPIKRIISEAKDRGVLIDATYGRRTRSVIITDSDHIVLSAVQPETISNRAYDIEDEGDEEEEDGVGRGHFEGFRIQSIAPFPFRCRSSENKWNHFGRRHARRPKFCSARKRARASHASPSALRRAAILLLEKACLFK